MPNHFFQERGLFLFFPRLICIPLKASSSRCSHLSASVTVLSPLAKLSLEKFNSYHFLVALNIYFRSSHFKRNEAVCTFLCQRKIFLIILKQNEIQNASLYRCGNSCSWNGSLWGITDGHRWPLTRCLFINKSSVMPWQALRRILPLICRSQAIWKFSLSTAWHSILEQPHKVSSRWPLGRALRSPVFLSPQPWKLSLSVLALPLSLCQWGFWQGWLKEYTRTAFNALICNRNVMRYHHYLYKLPDQTMLQENHFYELFHKTTQKT